MSTIFAPFLRAISITLRAVGPLTVLALVFAILSLFVGLAFDHVKC
jgi:hypothetical protein